MAPDDLAPYNLTVDNLAPDNLTMDNLAPDNLTLDSGQFGTRQFGTGQFSTVLIKGQFCIGNDTRQNMFYSMYQNELNLTF